MMYYLYIFAVHLTHTHFWLKRASKGVEAELRSQPNQGFYMHPATLDGPELRILRRKQVRTSDSRMIRIYKDIQGYMRIYEDDEDAWNPKDHMSYSDS